MLSLAFALAAAAVAADDEDALSLGPPPTDFSEAELDSLIASAGTRRGCLAWCFGACGACAVRIYACARMSLCGRKCAVGLEARRHAGAVDAGADLARRRSVAVLREWGEARTHERSRVYDVLCRR